MKYRVTLFTMLVLLTGCSPSSEQSATATAAEPQQTFKWKLVTTWPKNFPGLGEAPENFAKLVDEMSAGRLKVKVYGAGQMVPALEVFDAVSQGTAQMGHGASYYWTGKLKVSALFTSIPFGLNAQEMNGWLHYGGGQQLWEEVYKPFNLIPMAGGNTGVQMGGWFNREINSLNDLKGLKMRMPGMGGEVLTRVGVETVNIPGGELYTSMQTGVIDATEWVAPFNDVAFGLHQVAKYYYYPGWHEPGPTLEFIINESAMASLPADLKAIVRTAARAINQDMLDEYTARNNQSLEQLINEHGITPRRFPDDVLIKLRAVSEQVYADVSEEDADFKRVYESQKAFMDQVVKYHAISEEAYYQARKLGQ